MRASPITDMGILDRPSAAKVAEINSRQKTRAVNLMDKASERTAPRAFTPAEKSLIAAVHGYMPAQQLLEVLNERLACDHPNDAPHTMEQLHAEVGAAAKTSDAHDWTGLRKLLAGAKRAGTLEHITRQVIDDFAVVWSLNTAQVLRLQDVLLRAREDAE